MEDVYWGPENTIQVQIMDSVIPADFVGICGHFGEAKNHELLMEIEGVEYSLDPTTFNAVRCDDYQEAREVSYDSEKLVVSYEGVTMVLPPEMRGFGRVIINEDAINVKHEHITSFVLPLEYPDFRQGYRVYADVIGGDNRCINERGCSSGMIFANFGPGCTVSKADFYRKQMVHVVNYYTSSPINLATYNGLSWLTVLDSTVAVLNDSEPAYYRKDRLMPNANHSIQGKTKLGGDRLIMCENGPIYVIDLLTGIMTRVRGASRLSSCGLVGHWFPPFSGGVLGVWAFSDECLRRLHKELDAQRKEGERDEYQLRL